VAASPTQSKKKKKRKGLNRSFENSLRLYFPRAKKKLEDQETISLSCQFFRRHAAASRKNRRGSGGEEGVRSGLSCSRVFCAYPFEIRQRRKGRGGKTVNSA